MADPTVYAETITEGWRALDLFTDRHHAIRLFLAYLHDRPPREQILFFHGDGGNGKSLLLRFLYTHCCKRLRAEEWEYVKTVPHTELEAFLQRTEGREPLPYARLDFGTKSQESGSPQDPFAALLMLRRQLARHHMHFPLFDFACVWYLRETGQLTTERLRSLFPAEELDFISELVTALGTTSYAALAKTALNLMSKHLRERFTLYQYQRKLDETQVATICRMDVHTELLDALPRFFASDLNTLMVLPTAPARLVLFFDTHEAFWGVQERESSRDWRFQRDEWLRQLLLQLNRAQGVVVVVAGRDKPQWAHASRMPIRSTVIDTHLVGHLSAADAKTYLARAGIGDPAMRACLVQYAQVEPDAIHPFYLGLCADVVLLSAAAGVTLTPEDFHSTPDLAIRATELLDRLLRYADTHVEYAVRVLSACRAFNREIYVALGQALHLQATPSAFTILCDFSFVWRDEGRAEGWYRIHDLVRQLMDKRQDEVTREAHVALEHYYRERAATGDRAARAEAIYHANHVEWERGIQEWIAVFETAISHSDYESCRALLVVRSALTIGTDMLLGQVSQCEGDYFLRLAQYEKARQEFTEALAAYDTALAQAPDDIYAHNNKGNALQSLGEVQATLAQHPEAITSYRAAIAAYDTALAQAPDYLYAHNNKGNALQSLGEVQATLAQHMEAITSYRAAIAAYDTALARAPDYLYAHNNKGNALQSLGEVQATLAQHPEARASFEAALTAYSRSLDIAPGDIHIRELRDQLSERLRAIRDQ